MQNSIWKLAALAGVAGIGFLVVLQAQRGLTQRGEQNEIETIGANLNPNNPAGGVNASANDAGGSLNGDSSNPFFNSNVALGQAEPDPGNDGDDAQAGKAPFGPIESFADGSSSRSASPAEAGTNLETSESASSTQSGVDFRDVSASENRFSNVNIFDPNVIEAGDESTAQSSPFGKNDEPATRPASRSLKTAPRQLPFDPNAVNQFKTAETSETGNAEQTPRFFADSRSQQNPLTAAEQIKAPNPRSIAADKTKAKELVRQARLELNAGRIAAARQKALQARELNAEFGDLEDRPGLILFDIDRLAANRNIRSIVQTDGVEKQPVAGSASQSIAQNADQTDGLNGPRLFPSTAKPSLNARVRPIGRHAQSPQESNVARPLFGEELDKSPGRVSLSDTDDEKSVGGNSAVKEPARFPGASLNRSKADPSPITFPKGNGSTAFDRTTKSPKTNPPSPSRLNPPLDPPRLNSTNAAADLHGDGTISKNAPRGLQRPQLTIEKLAPANAILGQPMIYSIIVKNHGSSAARQVVVEDRIPKGTKLGGTIPQAEMTGTRLIWRMGTLKPNEEKKISVKVIPVAAGQIGSVATVNFVAEVAAETLITAPKLQLEISAPQRAKLNKPVVFQFKVKNSGTGDATGVVLRDIIPDGLRHPAGNDLEYDVGTLPAGASRQIKLTLTAAQIGRAVNRVVVTADGGLRTEANAAVEIYGTQLKLSRTGPSRKYIGRAAVFGNIVTNNSGIPVAGITVVETLPKGMEFASASAAGQFNPAKRTVAWRVEKLDAKQSKVLSVTLVPKVLGSHNSIITASAASGERTEIVTGIDVIGIAALSIDFSDVNGAVARGERVSVQLRVRNRGSSAASNVGVKIVVPAELKFISAEGPVKYTAAGNAIQFQPVGTISGKSAAVFDLLFTAQKTGDARLAVHVECEQLSRPLTAEEAIAIFADDE